MRAIGRMNRIGRFDIPMFPVFRYLGINLLVNDILDVSKSPAGSSWQGPGGS